MSDETQALAFFAGANSIFYGERLLTAQNPQASHDQHLFERLGLYPEIRQGFDDAAHEAMLYQQMQETRLDTLVTNAAVS